MNWKIPLFKIYWDDSDIDAITKIIKRGTYWTGGPEIQQLEETIASYVQRKYALTFNSGTSALHADLLAHDITSGEIIVPSFTFIATANTVVLAGAKPIFADIEEDSYGLDPEDVKEKITGKTKAIIPVHYGGNACRHIKALHEIAEDHNLVLLEDAAESIGAKFKNKMVGTFGNSSMFSFCQNKIITAGEGGILTTNQKDIYKKLKLIRSHGRLEKNDEYFSTSKELDYIQVGYNYRMSSITAALVLSQYKKINKIIKMRRQKAHYITKNLTKIQRIKIPTEQKDQYHVYQMYTIQLENEKTRNNLQQHLMKKKILTKVYFEPIHLKTYYKKRFKYKVGDLPKTESTAKKVLTLPLYPSLEKYEIDYLLDMINNYFG